MVGRGGIYDGMHGDGQPAGKPATRDPNPDPDPEPGAIIFWYKNWRGEEGYRRVRPINMRWGSSKWHKEPQWLMLGYDTENDKQREFAVRDMSSLIGSPLIEFGHTYGQYGK